MTDKSWTEIQALAVKAATGAGVPTGQALSFGTMLTRHLADEGAEAPLSHALNSPDSIVALAHQVETLIEAASLSRRLVTTHEARADRRALLVSWLNSLPCQAQIAVTDTQVSAILSLSRPSTQARPDRVTISDGLFAQLDRLAQRTYVPDSDASRASGAGAGLMELD